MIKSLNILILLFLAIKSYPALIPTNVHIPNNEELRGDKHLEAFKDFKDATKTSGRPFPKPQSQILTDIQQILDERDFSFQYGKSSVVCDLLNLAFNRFYKIIFRPQTYDIRGDGVTNRVRKLNSPIKKNKENIIGQPRLLKRVIVNVQMPCEDYPSLESDESCLYLILCFKKKSKK
jgi:hypothetical protein